MGEGTGKPASADPSAVMQLSTAYWGSQVLLTANRIGLFGALADGAKTAAELAAALGLHERGAGLLLGACVGLGLLAKDGDGYRVAAPAAHFLVPGSAGFLGNAIRYSDDLYETWGKLEDGLRSGAPVLEAKNYLGTDAEATRHFVYGMHDRALGIGRALVALVDLGQRRTLLDVGGGPGTYAALFAGQHPGLNATVLELPGVAQVAREILVTMPGGDRVEMLPGSYHETPFPDHQEVVLMSGMFHRETEATCRELVGKASDALDSGGLLIVSDVFADADGTGPVFATLFGLNMYLTAPDGGVHADADVAEWMRQAGFEDVTRTPFPPPMPHRIVTGIRP